MVFAETVSIDGTAIVVGLVILFLVLAAFVALVWAGFRFARRRQLAPFAAVVGVEGVLTAFGLVRAGEPPVLFGLVLAAHLVAWFTARQPA